ncbi:MAG TPA: thiamine-phosphate kinase [Acidobacteriaceae bacterium]|nr:thiamine-phosphate kinase [Acidobacteriaceae bacterium]
MKAFQGELELIEQIRRAAESAGSNTGRKRAGVVLGIGDDCAILQPPRGHEVLVTTDFTLEGRHFRRDWHPAESVGHRALARGLSDLAAMGARPLAAFLSLALPKEMVATQTGRRWVQRFFTGLQTLAIEHGVPLAGGDTSESPSNLVLADIVLTGSAPARRALRRSGGRPGDCLYVTGTLGGAAAELDEMAERAAKVRSRAQRNPRTASETAEHPQLFPQPRLQVGLALLRRRFATAAIDLSDGLSTDLAHLCRESRVGAEISAAALPIHPLASRAGAARGLVLALNGGEDYELLFSAPPSVRMPRTIARVPITQVGKLMRGNQILIVDSSGNRQPLKPSGWEHFAR